MLRNKRSHHSENPAHCTEEYARLTTTRESPRAVTKTQHSKKKKKERDEIENKDTIEKKISKTKSRLFNTINEIDKLSVRLTK